MGGWREVRCPGGYLPCRAGSFPPPPSSLLTFGIFGSVGETEVQGGGDLSRCKVAWPAPSLGCSTSKHTHTHPTHSVWLPPTPLVLSWGLERGRGCLGLGQPAVHFDPSSLPARLLTDCHSSAPCRHSQGCHGRSWALTPPTSTLLPGQLPTPVPGGRGSKAASPFQVAVRRDFCFCFCCHLCKY